MTGVEELLAQAAARAITFFREREGRPVFPDEESVHGLTAFVEAMPDGPADPVDVIELLDEIGTPGTVASSGGRYFGFVTGSAHPVGVAASWLASAWDQNAAVGVMSPTAAVLDTVAGAWLVTLLDLPRSGQVSFVPGTSAANVTCLATARDALLHEAGWDSVADGLFGAPELRVVIGESAHSSVRKALTVVGVGRDRIVTVPADNQGRLRADLLPDPGPSTIVVAQAGNVNSGACDPFGAIADHFAGSSTWIHVDGAFGLWAAASPTLRTIVDGVDRANSWAVDMHKWLNVPYDSAVAIVRDPADVARTFRVSAAYLPDNARLDPLHRGLDMSQRARAVETWAVLKTLGRTGVADLIDRTCAHARRFATELARSGFTIHNDVVLNQVMISLETDEETEILLDAVSAEGTMWAGGSMWNGRRVMRISVSSWATTDDDVDRCVTTLTGLADAIRRSFDS